MQSLHTCKAIENPTAAVIYLQVYVMRRISAYNYSGTVACFDTYDFNNHGMAGAGSWPGMS